MRAAMLRAANRLAAFVVVLLGLLTLAGLLRGVN